MKRCEYLDNAKGIGILLLMLGHTSGLPIFLYEFIFSFHVPLFFFVSGFLMSERIDTESALKNISKINKRILVPLIFYFVISYFLWTIRVVFDIGIDEKPFSIFLPLYQFVSGDIKFTEVNSTLWYFLCIYNVVLIYVLAKKVISNEYVILVISSFAVIFLNINDLFSPEVRSIYNIDIALMALPFFCLGALDRKYFNLTSREYSTGKIFMVLIAFLCLALANGKVDMNKFNFGSSVVLFYLDSFLGIFITLYLSKNVNSTYVKKLFTWISCNSIVIFPMHIIIYSLITGFMLYWGVNIKEYSGLILSILYIIVTLSVIFGVVNIWPKKFYFVMGK